LPDHPSDPCKAEGNLGAIMGNDTVTADFRSLQRWSAVGLYGVLVPLMGLAELTLGNVASEPITLTLGTTLLVSQMAICAVWGDGMPSWVWAAMVAVTPIALAAYAASSPPAAAALLPLLVVTVGWAAVFLPSRLVMVSAAVSGVAAAGVALMERPALHMLVPVAIEVVTLLVVAGTVHKLVASLKGARLRAEEKANTDPLTGARSRACILEELRALVATEEKANGLILFDLDHFKRINDTKGHVAGDLVLQAVVSRVREVVRGRDVIGRLGGEEFLVVLDGLDDEETLLAIGEKVRASVCSRPVSVPGGEVVPTISAGAMIMPPDGMSLREALLTVDGALYAAKGSGRNRVILAGSVEAAADQAAVAVRIEESLPMSIEAPALARHAISPMKHRISADLYDRTALVVSELVAGGILDGSVGEIELRAECLEGRVTLQVSSPGSGSSDGRSMRLVRQLVDSIGTEVTDRRRVRCSLGEERPAAPAVVFSA
jgi:diguanylate cyclase (GGDEF)-like protein